jgi:hypothetical protein
MDTGMGGAIMAVAATTTVGTAAVTMVGTAATTMVGGIIAIGGDFHPLPDRKREAALVGGLFLYSQRDHHVGGCLLFRRPLPTGLHRPYRAGNHPSRMTFLLRMEVPSCVTSGIATVPPSYFSLLR